MCNQGIMLSVGAAIALRIGLVLVVAGLVARWAYQWFYCRPRKIGPWKRLW